MLFNWVTFSLVAVVVGSAQSQIARRDSVELGIKTRSHLGATMFIILAGAVSPLIHDYALPVPIV